MAKGTVSKTQITNKILELFPGSFTYDKEIRIPIIEDGEEIQIKVTLTCAKTNVEQNGDIAVPGLKVAEDDNKINFVDKIAEENKVTGPTQEEKDNIKRLMESLGL